MENLLRCGPSGWGVLVTSMVRLIGAFVNIWSDFFVDSRFSSGNSLGEVLRVVDNFPDAHYL